MPGHLEPYGSIYLRNYYPDRHFTSLNRYKEKCFPIKPLMRELMNQGKLTGASAALMSPTVPPEQLFDTVADPHEIHNLADSEKPDLLIDFSTLTGAARVAVGTELAAMFCDDDELAGMPIFA